MTDIRRQEQPQTVYMFAIDNTFTLRAPYGPSGSHATPRAEALREVVLDILQGLPLRLQQTEIQKHGADAADGTIEEEGAVQVEGMFDVEERLGAEEEEHVAACRRDASGEPACPVACDSYSVARITG
jgi:hypothetical protein